LRVSRTSERKKVSRLARKELMLSEDPSIEFNELFLVSMGIFVV
jgi:hypothetical protein